jgi:hypothetical protein
LRSITALVTSVVPWTMSPTSASVIPAISVSPRPISRFRGIMVVRRLCSLTERPAIVEDEVGEGATDVEADTPTIAHGAVSAIARLRVEALVLGQGGDLGGTPPSERMMERRSAGSTVAAGKDRQSATSSPVVGSPTATESAHAAHRLVAGFGETLVANARQAGRAGRPTLRGAVSDGALKPAG